MEEYWPNLSEIGLLKMFIVSTIFWEELSGFKVFLYFVIYGKYAEHFLYCRLADEFKVGLP